MASMGVMPSNSSSRENADIDNVSSVSQHGIFLDLPEGVLMNVFDKLSVDDLKNCRLTCQRWDEIILLSELLDIKSCFIFDGRQDDNVGGKCAL